MSNKYFRVGLIPEAASEEDLYEVPPANVAILKSLRVTNDSAARSSITIVQYGALGTTPLYLLKGFVLPVSASFDLLNGVPCILQEGDKIAVESSEDDVNFYLSYLEVDRT
jgi:hypothetical protein